MQLIKTISLLLILSATQSSMGIITPRPGDVLQGEILISVAFDRTDFITAELEFRNTGDYTDTWFLLSQINPPNPNDVLIVWDTSVITDGSYDLRLRIVLQDQSEVVAIVQDLKIRNYTAIETMTTPTIEEPIYTLSDFVPYIPLISATRLSKNKASLSQGSITASLGYGLLVAIVVLFAVPLYIRIRNK